MLHDFCLRDRRDYDYTSYERLYIGQDFSTGEGDISIHSDLINYMNDTLLTPV